MLSDARQYRPGSEGTCPMPDCRPKFKAMKSPRRPCCTFGGMFRLSATPKSSMSVSHMASNEIAPSHVGPGSASFWPWGGASDFGGGTKATLMTSFSSKTRRVCLQEY